MLAIIQNIQDDEERAFVEQIYEKYEGQMYLISMKYLHDHHEAQDCVHDTIRNIIEAVERFKTAKDMKYLERLIIISCRNCAINRLNEKIYRNKHEESLEKYNYEEDVYETVEIPDYNSAVDKLYISEQNCDALHDAINKLDDKYRDVVLYKSLGFDDHYIAKAMNISDDLVRKRYSRAKKQLWEMGGKDLYVE